MSLLTECAFSTQISHAIYCMVVDTFSSSDIYFENKIFNTEIDLKAILDYFYYLDNKYCPLSIIIELLNNCNFNCGFCYIHNRNFSKQIDFNQLISILKILIKNGLLHCVLTGGEIFMYPEFIKLYTFLKENGVLVTLFTNLSLLNDNILTVLKKYKPFNVDVTLYGFNQKVFESTTNAKNVDCKSILKNIKLLKTNGINVSCKTLNVANNICDFDVIKEWCKKENINFRYSSNLFSKYNGDFPIEYQINNNDIYYQKYKEKTLTKNNKKINFSCSVSKHSLFLGYDLKIRPCWKFYNFG